MFYEDSKSNIIHNIVQRFMLTVINRDWHWVDTDRVGNVHSGCGDVLGSWLLGNRQCTHIFPLLTLSQLDLLPDGHHCLDRP